MSTDAATGLLYTLDGSNATITELGTYNLGANGLLTIPGQVGGSYTVVAIGANAFMLPSGISRTDIKTVELPNSLLSIGDSAFFNCTALNSITWSNSLLSIGSQAFQYCAFTNLVLPNSITTINVGAFLSSNNLESVILPNSLTTLGYGAFSGGASLNTVTFANVVGSVGTDNSSGFHVNAFYNTPNTLVINTSTDVTLWPTYSSGAGGATGFMGGNPVPAPQTVVQGTPLAPTASAQTFTSPADVGDLTATRVSVNAALKWYSTSSGGSNLPPRTALATGTYYVSQSLISYATLDLTPLESTRTSVSVTVQAAEVACFAEGTRVLTQNGYKAIEALKFTDLLVTADQRIIDFKLLKTTLGTTTERTAPYLIQPHAFGHNAPSAPIRLSATHKIQLRKGLWTSPATAALTNPLVKQCAVGEPVTYYHIECENYLQDNIVTEGLKTTGGRTDIYTWNSRKNAYTRLGNMDSAKSKSA